MQKVYVEQVYVLFPPLKKSANASPQMSAKERKRTIPQRQTTRFETTRFGNSQDVVLIPNGSAQLEMPLVKCKFSSLNFVKKSGVTLAKSELNIG